MMRSCCLHCIGINARPGDADVRRTTVRQMSDSSNSGRRLPSESIPIVDLLTALGEGDPQKVRALIEAGADVCYKRDDGYDALLDAIHGRDVRRDPRLLELADVAGEPRNRRLRHQRIR